MPTVKKGYCTLCRSRCGTLNTVENDQLIKVEPDPEHPTGQAICPKGRPAPERAHDRGGHADAWDEALDARAHKLGQLRAASRPQPVAFGVKTHRGTPLSDSIDWIARFVRAFGRPSLACAAEVCNSHKDHAHEF